jgi:hypothetical protein
MPEETKNTAQTTDADGAGVNVNADVDTDNAADSINDADFTDGGTDSPSTDTVDGKKTDEAKQTKEQNAANARRRREAEGKAQPRRSEETRFSASELEAAKQSARDAAIIEALGGKNPYTNEEMKDSTDVREFLTMRDIEKKGGDPLTDFAKHVKEKERQAEADAQKKAADAEWYTKDYDAFVEKHPDVDVAKLIADPVFQKYTEGRVGQLPLSTMYESFLEITGSLEKRAEDKAKQTLANKRSSPGALSGASPSGSGFFTREQVQRMSQKEVHENYDKIRASMSKWK